MKYLLDTVTLSDPFAPRPNEGVAAWVASQPDDLLCTSVICLGEIRRGLAALGPGSKRSRIERWLADATAGLLEMPILPLTIEVAERWGSMIGLLERTGRRPQLIDSLIAATALVHGLTVVTRNTRDFESYGVVTLNPWT